MRLSSLTYAAVVWCLRMKKVESQNLLKSLQLTKGCGKDYETNKGAGALCIPLFTLGTSVLPDSHTD